MKHEAGGEDGAWLCVTPESMVEDYDHYKHFMDHFGSVIVGQTNFSMSSKMRPPEDWLSTSGEAFALLMMRNYHESAVAQATGIRRRGYGRGRGRWTFRGASKDFINDEGLGCYEDLYDRVLKARNDQARRKYSCRYWQSKMECKQHKNDAIKRPVRCEAEVQEFY